MMNKTLRFLLAAFIVLGFSFDSYAVSCNRNAEVHKSRAQNIMFKTNAGQVVTIDDEEFMLCMLQEKEDKQDFQTRVRNNRENERKRAAAEAQQRRAAEIERNRPYTAAECAGDNRPCGHACYNPLSGQACVNGNVICTPEGQRNLLCAPTAAQQRAAQPVDAATSAPLKHGTYVNKQVDCAIASNSTQMSFNGLFFSAGRMPNVTVKRSGNGSSYVGYYRDQDSGKQIRQIYTVKSPTEYVLTTPFGASTYRFCGP